MKTKRKEKKEKKKRQEAKRKTYWPDPSSGAHQAMGESLTSRPRGIHTLQGRNFIIKTFGPY